MPTPSTVNTTGTTYGAGSLSFTPGAGANYVLAGVFYNGSSSDGTATFGGVAMTELAGALVSDGFRYVKLFGIAVADPTVSATFSASGTSTPRQARLVGLADADTASPLRAAATTVNVNSATTALSQTTASDAADLAMAMVFGFQNAVTLTASSPTQVVGQYAEDFFGVAVKEAGAASVTLEGTWSTAVAHYGFVFSLEGTVSGGTTHDGAAAFSASGTLSATPAALLAGAESGAGVGTLAGTPGALLGAAESGGGTGTVGATVHAILAAAAGFGATGTLSATASLVLGASWGGTGTGTLVGDGALPGPGAAFSGAGTLAPAAGLQVGAAGAADAVGTLAGSAALVQGAEAAGVAAGTLAGTASQQLGAAAALAATGALAASATLIPAGTALFRGTLRVRQSHGPLVIAIATHGPLLDATASHGPLLTATITRTPGGSTMIPLRSALYVDAASIYNRRTGAALTDGQLASFTVNVYRAPGYVDGATPLATSTGTVESATRAYAQFAAADLTALAEGETYDLEYVYTMNSGDVTRLWEHDVPAGRYAAGT